MDHAKPTHLTSMGGTNPPSTNVLSVLESLRLHEESRHQRSLDHLNRVTQLIQEIAKGTEAAGPGVMVYFTSAVERTGLVLTPIQIVREAVETFGENEFTLGQLCARVQQKFPGIHLGRTVVSRRLYDLRHGHDPLVVTVEPSDQANISTMRRGKRPCYKRRKIHGLQSAI